MNEGNPSPIPEPVEQTLAALKITVSDSARAMLNRYLDLLLEVNQQFNLTGIKSKDAAWQRHIVDSLTLLPLLADLPAGAAVIDVGSGGGLPGIPLVIARPELKVTLLEATGKKAAFLHRCAKEFPLPNARVVNDRAEVIGQDFKHREKYDAVVCRAVGPMRELLEYTLPLVKVGGRLLAMKGARVAEELDAAGDALMTLGGGALELIEPYPPQMNIESAIVSVTKDQPTPKLYPRKPGMPRMSPI